MEQVRATFNNTGLSAKDASNAELFLANYYGETEIAKWALSFVNTGAHDGQFIPWTIMTTALKLLDWKSTIELVTNEDGGYVFRDQSFVETTQVKVDGVNDQGVAIERSTVTKNTTQAFYVKLRIVYFGEESIHEYAVLNTGHQPVQYLDSQLVNKAIQRNKARAISLVTGIGLSLWTGEEASREKTEDVTTTIEPKKQKLTKDKKDDKIKDLPEGKQVEDVLAEFIQVKIKDKAFTEKHGQALKFASDTFNVDFEEKDVKKLSKTLLNINDLESFAKLLMGDE